MSSTAHAGPLVVFGQATAADYNLSRSPSLFDMGTALLDSRPAFTYQNGGRKMVYGFWQSPDVQTLNVVPSALAANNIAASQTPVAATAMTLVPSSGAGVTVGVTVVRSDTGATVTGLLALDGAAAPVAMGQDGRYGMWDPTTLLSRNVRITSVGNDSAATFTVRGYDAYGVALTETITGANAGVASGKKAFKYIASVTPAGTLSGSAATVGTGDVIGLPLRADNWGDLAIVYNAASVTASTGFLAGVTTTASATTGDVRGTYALQSASDGVKRLQVFQSPTLANVQTVAGMFGVTQF